jgi:hypothetical protein
MNNKYVWLVGGIVIGAFVWPRFVAPMFAPKSA